MKTYNTEPLDQLNYWAIDYLEKLGNDTPSEEQITTMERMLEMCGLVGAESYQATFYLSKS